MSHCHWCRFSPAPVPFGWEYADAVHCLRKAQNVEFIILFFWEYLMSQNPYFTTNYHKRSFKT
ncbi:MAG: hypothetical protein ACFFB5_04005 [Promethearchaeota archaeon]